MGSGMKAPSLSALDLVLVNGDKTVRDAIEESARLAQHLEKLEYVRIWYAEHHNMDSIASSATSVLIGYIASKTERIRVGAGGVMLPNHSPLVIAEQFGTLEWLYPGRIDLGVGRAPGTDQMTLTALRRDNRAAERFPQDVADLMTLLDDPKEGQLIQAVPGQGTKVPIYILGSSLFGANLAAELGLPYAFASHFAPQALYKATQIYREKYKPSERHPKPHLIIGMNAVVAEDADQAEELFERQRREMALRLIGRRAKGISPDHPALLESAIYRQVRSMLSKSAVGTPEQAALRLIDLANETQADEVMVVMNIDDEETRLRSFTLLAEAVRAF